MDAASISVLLIDDNAELLELLSRALTHLGKFTVLRAANGESGLEQAMEAHPDCIVVDIMMPGPDGYWLARALRGDPQTSEIPIIILTALAQDRNRMAGLLSGADHYLVKPVKPQDLVATIHQAITYSREDRSNRLRELIENDEAGAS